MKNQEILPQVEKDQQSGAVVAALLPFHTHFSSPIASPKEVDALTEEDKNDLIAFSYLLQEQEDSPVDCFSSWAVEDVPVGLFSAPVDPVNFSSTSGEQAMASMNTIAVDGNTLEGAASCPDAESVQQKVLRPKRRMAADDIDSVSAILVKYSEEKGEKTSALKSRKTKANIGTSEPIQNESNTSQKRQKVKRKTAEPAPDEIYETQIIPVSIDEEATHDHPSLR